MKTMAEEEPRNHRSLDTFTTLALVGAGVLTVIALVKAADIWMVVLAVAGFLVAMILMRPRAGSDLYQKEVIVTVSHVAADRLPAYAKSLEGALAGLGRVQVQRAEAGTIVLSVLTPRPLQELVARIDGLKLKTELAGVRCEIKYQSIAASAEMFVEIRGQAPPDSKLEITGLSEPVVVNQSGQFLVRVPFSLVRKYAGSGYIPAVCKRGTLAEEIKIPVPK